MAASSFLSPIRLAFLLAVTLYVLGNSYAYPVPAQSSSFQAHPHDERRLGAVGTRAIVVQGFARSRSKDYFPPSTWLGGRDQILVGAEAAAQRAPPEASTIQPAGKALQERTSAPKLLSSLLKPKSSQASAKTKNFGLPAGKVSTKSPATAKSFAEAPPPIKPLKDVPAPIKPSVKVSDDAKSRGKKSQQAKLLSMHLPPSSQPAMFPLPPHHHKRPSIQPMAPSLKHPQVSRLAPKERRSRRRLQRIANAV